MTREVAERVGLAAGAAAASARTTATRAATGRCAAYARHACKRDTSSQRLPQQRREPRATAPPPPHRCDPSAARASPASPARARRHAGVQPEQRVARARPQRAPRPAQARARGRPARVSAHPSASAERMLGAGPPDAPARARTARAGEPWFASNSTASASGACRRRRSSRVLHARGGQVGRRGRARLPERPLDLGQQGERASSAAAGSSARRRRAAALRRSPPAASIRASPVRAGGRPGRRGARSGRRRARRRRGRACSSRSPSSACDVGGALGRCRRRRPPAASPRSRAGQVAVTARGSRTTRAYAASAGLEVDEPLDRARRVAVAAELDLGVGDHGQRPGQLGRDRARLAGRAAAAPRKSWRSPASVPGADQAAPTLARVAPQRRVERALRARVEAGVAGLARARDMRRRARRRRRRCRGGAHRALESAPGRRRGAGSRRRQRRRRGRRRRSAPTIADQHRAEDGERSISEPR